MISHEILIPKYRNESKKVKNISKHLGSNELPLACNLKDSKQIQLAWACISLHELTIPKNPKHFKRIKKIPKDTKTFRKNPKDSKKIQMIPKKYERIKKIQKVLNESKRFQKILHIGLKKANVSCLSQIKEIEAPQRCWLGTLKTQLKIIKL